MAESKSDMPLLLRIGKVLSLAVGGIFLLAAILGSLGLVDFLRLRDSSLGDWAVPAWCVGMFLFGLMLLAIGIGLRSQRPWARPLMLAFWGLPALGNIVWFAIQIRRQQAATSDFTSLPILLVAVWYLYGKRNVVKYFHALKARQA